MSTNGRFKLPLTALLPVNLAVGLLCAVASAGAVWALLNRQVNDNTAALSRIEPLVAISSNDNRDQKFAIEALQKQMADTAARFDLSRSTVDTKLTDIQVSIARLQVTVENIAQASDRRLPGDRKPPMP